MRLYLSSFRLGDHPDRLIELTGLGRRAAVIVSALDHVRPELRRERVDTELVALRELGLDPFEVDLREFIGEPEGVRRALSDVGLVWLRGGNVFVLRQRLAETGLDRHLLESLAEDRFVVGGYSAGTCVLADSLAGLEDCDPLTDLARIAPDTEPIMTGLGILEGTVVPHLDSPEHPECAALTTIAERLRDEGRSIIELRDGDVLIMAGAERILLPRSSQA